MDNIIDNRNIYSFNSDINTLNNDKLLLHDDNSSLLILIIDLQNFLLFETDISKILKNVIIFINAHLAYSSSNKVCCIVNDEKEGTQFLYPNEDDISEQKEYMNEDTYQEFKKIDESILNKLNEIIKNNKTSQLTKQRSNIAGSMSCGLTYIHRVLKESISLKARMLVVTGESMNSNIVQSHQYIPIMNCIFTSQKLKCPIDVLKINDSNLKNKEKLNSFLQQATDATNGIYLEINDVNGMIQYLTTIFYLNTIITSTSIDTNLKINNSLDNLDKDTEDADILVKSHDDILVKPSTTQVDFRTSCFLTGKIVAVGFVCNVCLVVISYIPGALKDCPCCGSTFDVKSLKKLKYWQMQQNSNKKKGFIKKVNKLANPPVNGSGSSAEKPIEL